MRPSEPSAEPSAPAPLEVIAEIETGRRPVWMAASAGAIWVANTEEPSVSRIDPASNSVVAEIPVPAGKIIDIAANEDFVFVIRVDQRALDRIDVATNEVATFPVDSDFGGLAMGGGWLWHASSTGELLRIDPATGEVNASVAVGNPGPPADVVADDGGAWVMAGNELVRVTGNDTIAIEQRWPAPRESGLALDGGQVWAISGGGMAVATDVATGTQSPAISLGRNPYVSDARNGWLWFRGINLDLHRVDPMTGTTEAVYPIDGDDFPGGFLIEGDEAWIANLDRGSVSRIGLER